MSVDTFLAEIWTARLLARLNAAHIFGQSAVVNRDYEGEISQKGDVVHIGGIGRITIKTYTKNNDIDPPDDLEDEDQTLEIDQADYFNFQVDDVDGRQSAVNLLDGAMAQAGSDLSDVGDLFIASQMAQDGTPVTPIEEDLSQKGAAYEALIDMGVVLDEGNTPTSGRFAVVPSWFHGLLLKDKRFVGAGTSGAVLLTGQIGEAAGFAILKSNNLPVSSSDYSVLAGHQMATSFAEQINKVVAFRPEARFADAIKGLHLYGAKVVRPTALAVLTATRPS